MPHKLYDMLETIHDETSFVAFLAALIEDLEKHERAQPHDRIECAEGDHFTSHATRDFLRSMEEWAHGDFGEGEHHGEPILRRIATMLYVGRRS
ncbi:MAG TPA: hypothetical protein VEK11_22805 [Thermoanaerobaculia bacterium]|jgi:hypothetical protein|nr:hypothetical protein [Thermoanaerobaculia bacterium]